MMSGMGMLLKASGIDPDAILREVHGQIGQGVQAALDARQSLAEVRAIALAAHQQAERNRVLLEHIARRLGLEIPSGIPPVGLIEGPSHEP